MREKNTETNCITVEKIAIKTVAGHQLCAVFKDIQCNYDLLPLFFLQVASDTHIDSDVWSSSSAVWLSQSSGGPPIPLGPSWGSSSSSGGLLVPEAIAVVTS